ncbi:MAG: DNA topoisomerase III [Candidatus Cloacimonetes bacterium]|nr:DNA topoisomerase III [Candidatus Cloacimonadota bacterium]
MKAIVLAEKPSVGRELARVLGCNQKNKGYIEGKNYIITWALGHLATLAEPAFYDARYKHWSMNDLPIIPEKFKLMVIKKTSPQFNTVKNLIRRNDISEFIIATDAGREGELVARWIMILSGWKGPFKRLWISSQTDSAILDGFKKLKNGIEYDNLFQAAFSRAKADWLVGLNVSRALTCRFDSSLSAGRVQTPTLALIVDREKEIENFTPVDYWNVFADFGHFKAKWIGKNGEGRFYQKTKADEVIDKINGQTAIVTDIETERKKELPPLAYDLTELQREANKRYSFSAQHTLSIMQSLYERHKIVTYPRTDSRYITADIVPTLQDRLKAVNFGKYCGLVKPLQSVQLKPGKRFVNDAKVSDHHAIIPTEEKARLNDLSADELKIYDLVIRRFLAVLYPDYKYEVTKIKIDICGESFKTDVKSVIDAGWKIPENAEIENERIPANLKKNDRLSVKKTILEAKKTQPPARYTEATLLTAMESPGKFIEDEELRESIKDGGLGTPATRAEIIEKLLSNFYVEREGKSLIPTSRGRQLIDLVPEELRLPELTAKWEKRLSLIAKGTEKNQKFLSDIISNTISLVDEVKKSTKKFSDDITSENICPSCGSPMRTTELRGKKGFVCTNKKCGFKQSENGLSGNAPRRKSMNEIKQTRMMINKYSDNVNPDKTGDTLGDLLEAALSGKKKK